MARTSKEDALTPDELRRLLSYDQETGVFTRLVRVHMAKAGERAGHRRRDGYWTVGINKAEYLAHRLAWLYVHSEWPAQMIDHIDGNPSNNAVANLREATPVLNQQNRRKARSDSSLPMGVCRNRHGFRARIRHHGRELTIGTFKTPEQAYVAYVDAKRRLHSGATL